VLSVVPIRTTVMLVALVSLAATTARGNDVPKAALTPEQLFARSRAIASLRSYPKFLEYYIDTSYPYHNRTFRDWFAMKERTSDAKVIGETVPLDPEEERKRLHGINLAIGPFAVETNPDANPIIVQIMPLGGTSVFGLDQPVTGAKPTPEPSFEPGMPTIRDIGRIVVASHEYDVTRVGDEDVHGHATVHLALHPTLDPKRSRLRDIWIDAQTYEPLRLRVAGLLNGDPYDRATWTVEYRQVGETWLIDHIETSDSLKFGMDLELKGFFIGFHDYVPHETMDPAYFLITLPDDLKTY
jgi:hypothetical protein